MSDLDSTWNNADQLFSLSLRRPVFVMDCLFILAYLIEPLDTFVLRLDELLGEAILTTALGFLLVLLYLKACGRNLRDISFHRRFLTRFLLIAGISFVTLYVAAYAAQLILLRSSGEAASLAGQRSTR